MPDPKTLTPEFWKWVESHQNDDPLKLRLSAKKHPDIDIDAAITQIDCRKRFGKKLKRTLEEFPQFYFPSTLAGEQATGDLLAGYHTRFVRPDDILVDFTAGLGIDVTHLSRGVLRAFAVERQPMLAESLGYNADGLGIRNLEVIGDDCTAAVDTLKGTVAFIDPARRATDGKRVFGFADCQPDVLSLMPKIKSNFSRLIIKASPMLDITQTLSEIDSVTDIYVLGTPTECKELVVLADFSRGSGDVEPTIHAVTLTEAAETEFDYRRSEEAATEITYDRCGLTPGDILYEPFPATVKAGGVKLLARRYGIKKFHGNTHLYYGPEAEVREDFPGEKLRIVAVIPWMSKNLKRFRETYPNVKVSVRNFGMTADELRKKLGVRESGADCPRLFGVGLGQTHTDRLLIVTEP